MYCGESQELGRSIDLEEWKGSPIPDRPEDQYETIQDKHYII
jgi:hypothetical protein